MNGDGWRYAAASVVGTSHVNRNSPCQDANDCIQLQLSNNEKVFIGVVADGAGSSKCGGEGAAISCKVFVDLVSDYLSSGNTIDQISRETICFWLNVVKSALSKQAESVSQELRDYACTFLGAILGDSIACFVQVGDGVIVVSDSEENQYCHIFWPDRGEYENTTHFLSEEDLESHIQFDVARRSIEEIAILSDGLQRLALDYKTETTHGPFFKGLFAPFGRLESGRSDALSHSLADFLASQRINQRTDDDKTLVLATRRRRPIDVPADGGSKSEESADRTD